MIDLIRFRNLSTEAVHLAETGHSGKALQALDEARGMLLPKIYEPIPFQGRPEDDPTRTEADRAAWRAAR